MMLNKLSSKIVLCLVLIITMLGVSQIAIADKDTTPGPQKYKNELRSQLDGADGTPREGNNPTDQAQTSLASVASTPVGNGQQVDTPAAAVTGSHDHHVHPNDVLTDVKKTGIASNGCSVRYVDSGDTCTTGFKAGPSLSVITVGAAADTCVASVEAEVSLQGIKIMSSSNALYDTLVSKSTCNPDSSPLRLAVTR